MLASSASACSRVISIIYALVARSQGGGIVGPPLRGGSSSSGSLDADRSASLSCLSAAALDRG